MWNVSEFSEFSIIQMRAAAASRKSSVSPADVEILKVTGG